MFRRPLAAALAAGVAGSSLLLAAPTALAHENGKKPMKDNRGQAKTVELNATLGQLNFSGVSGTAHATVRNQQIRHIEVHANGLTPDAPHAMHIHFGPQARHECPTMAEAKNRRVDGTPRLSTADGQPAYGPIAVSLTTTGDTSPASGLALDRFPVSMGGQLDYSRDHVEVGSVDGIGSAKEIADAIRRGEGVVVVHGVDYNRNGQYDTMSAGNSELDPSLPAEGTDPAACGVLR
jgi:hypothetical protein